MRVGADSLSGSGVVQGRVFDPARRVEDPPQHQLDATPLPRNNRYRKR